MLSTLNLNSAGNISGLLIRRNHSLPVLICAAAAERYVTPTRLGKQGLYSSLEEVGIRTTAINFTGSPKKEELNRWTA